MLLWAVGIISTLGVAGTIAAVILVPGIAIPVLQQVTTALLRCKPCLAVLVAIALLFTGALYGVHVERERSLARLERLKQSAAAAAEARDAEIRADLERHYRPQLSALEERSKALQGEVANYANSREATNVTVGRCELGAGPLRLRRPR